MKNNALHLLVMKWNGRNGTMLHALIAYGIFAFMATGCAKEEVAAPQMPQAEMHTKVGSNVSVGQGDGSSAAPISDDGDDLGDKEHPRKPRN